MSKRSTEYPYRVSQGESKLNSSKAYTDYIKNPSKINPVWLRDNYGVRKTEVEK